jgi:serine/threonine-protein kinase
LEGESVAAALARAGRLPLEAAVAILLGVLRALEAAHRAGIIHRDLKPENVFLHRSNGTGAVETKLLDFGIAKVLAPIGPTPRTRTDAILGTPDYLSPEQASGEGTIDARSDLFAAAVVLFELVTGERPFRAPSAIATAYRVVHAPAPTVASFGGPQDPALEAVLSRALRKNREQRYATAGDLARDLERLAPDAERRGAALDGVVVRKARSVRIGARGPTGTSVIAATEHERVDSDLPTQGAVEPERLRPLVGSTFPVSGEPRARAVVREPISGRTSSAPAPAVVGSHHVRGSVLRALDQATVERYGADARERVVARLPATYADDFRHRSVIALVLYDVVAFEAFSRALNELCAGGDAAVWHQLGRMAATSELSTLVRPLLRLPDATSVVRRGAPIWARLFDFGRFDVESSDRSLVLKVTDFAAAPVALRAWLVGLVEGTLVAAGQSGVSVSATKGEALRTADLEIEIGQGSHGRGDAPVLG